MFSLNYVGSMIDSTEDQELCRKMDQKYFPKKFLFLCRNRVNHSIIPLESMRYPMLLNLSKETVKASQWDVMEASKD